MSRAELISIGNEVLSGRSVNTNAAFLARHLSDLGIVVQRHTVIADDPGAIRQAVEDALERAEIVIATGGLGPTIDDLTKDSVRSLFSSAPHALKNEIGTASGLLYKREKRLAIFLPGVPREMEAMFLREVVPQLPRAKEYFQRGLSLCLWKEVEVDPFLRDLQKAHPETQIGIYPAQGTLRVECAGSDLRVLETICDQIERKYATYAFHEEKIAQALHGAFLKSGLTLALAESCTGGAIAASLTAIPDASKFFLGSLVVYSNAWKQKFLGAKLENGAVSFEAVEEMVEGLLQRTDADFAAAVSGIAGPTGGTPQKPVGTIFIAIGKRGEKVDAGVIHAPLDRASAIDLTVQTTLSALWRRLVHKERTFS